MKRYEQAKKDYEYLVAHHGNHVNDLTGGYVADEAYFELLQNPSKKNAYQHYCSLITHFADSGVEDMNHGVMGVQPDFEDKEVCNIFRRNYNEDNILRSWGVDISEEEEEEE